MITEELESVRVDEVAKVVVIDPKKVCEELGFVVLDPAADLTATREKMEQTDFIILDPKDFEDIKERMSENGWEIFENFGPGDLEAKAAEEGHILLDVQQDPDPYGNHGIPLWLRLQKMGWPINRPLIVERQDPVRAEDLL